MKVDDGSIVSVFSSDKQLRVPVYQRPYSWRRAQCKRLWQDLVEMHVSNRDVHFLGSFVTIDTEASSALGNYKEFMIVDGQQRLTTVTLMLIALREFCKRNSTQDDSLTRLLGDYLKNRDIFKNDKQYKLLLTRSDRDQLIALIDDLPTLSGPESSPLLENYRFFEGKIASQELTPLEVLECISRLSIVNITLNCSQDDPQRIFESLNSTGMDLSKADLIRNFLLMGLPVDEQDYVYRNYWRPFEKLFDGDTADAMDNFFRDFLTCHCGKIPTLRDIYEEFKRYRRTESDEDTRDFCARIFAYGKYYTHMVMAKSGDPELDSIFRNIRELRMDVALPLLMQVYADYDEGRIGKHDFVRILRLCESYVLRRAICKIPTNSMNKTFLIALRKIDPQDYVESFSAFLALQKSYQRFPDDAEFGQALKSADIYNTRIKKYILCRMENYGKKGPINGENFSVEHIMPQTLTPEWRQALGEDWEKIHSMYLHTLGNLTLTAVNAAGSNRPFLEKRDMKEGYAESALKINKYVNQQDTWDGDKIQARACELVELASAVWAYPVLMPETLEMYETRWKTLPTGTQYSFDHYAFSPETEKLYHALEEQVRERFPELKRSYMKFYITFRLKKCVFDVVPQKSQLKIVVNLKFPEVFDPKGICRDMTHCGRWGNGDVSISINSASQLADVINIIAQAYDKQKISAGEENPDINPSRCVK